jgi:hypothetical protein
VDTHSDHQTPKVNLSAEQRKQQCVDDAIKKLSGGAKIDDVQCDTGLGK